MEKQSVKAKQNSDRLVCRLGRDSGVVMLEFALMMPLLLTWWRCRTCCFTVRAL